jgi:hypothetical protein
MHAIIMIKNWELKEEQDEKKRGYQELENMKEDWIWENWIEENEVMNERI